MAEADARGRPNQKSRTRKDLLRAAARLMQAGRSPTLEEVAEEAMVSRATAYRYFPGIEALLTEAALDVEVPTPEALFEGEPLEDPVTRLLKVDSAMSAMIRANEPALRAMLVHSLQQSLGGQGEAMPIRQNRRTPLIEAALAPASLAPWARGRLTGALALVIGTEAMLAFKDVLRLADEEADSVRRWMIRSLYEAARKA
jgi:AcrR family transcriptional regulator